VGDKEVKRGMYKTTNLTSESSKLTKKVNASSVLDTTRKISTFYQPEKTSKTTMIASTNSMDRKTITHGRSDAKSIVPVNSSNYKPLQTPASLLHISEATIEAMSLKIPREKDEKVFVHGKAFIHGQDVVKLQKRRKGIAEQLNQILVSGQN
jgi:hypothetical protein